MKITQELKGRVKVKLREEGFEYMTTGGSEVCVWSDGEDNSVEVYYGTRAYENGRCDAWFVDAESALELSVFFKKLAKKLAARGAE